MYKDLPKEDKQKLSELYKKHDELTEKIFDETITDYGKRELEDVRNEIYNLEADKEKVKKQEEKIKEAKKILKELKEVKKEIERIK